LALLGFAIHCHKASQGTDNVSPFLYLEPCISQLILLVGEILKDCRRTISPDLSAF
jgi:hypothetical protein